MSDMVVDGSESHELLDLSLSNKGDARSVIVGKPSKGRVAKSQKMSKVDSDLEILSELSGDSDGIKFNRPRGVRSKKSEYLVEESLKTTVESSEDDLDSDLERGARIPVIHNRHKDNVEVATISNKRAGKVDKQTNKKVRVRQTGTSKKKEEKVGKGKKGKSVGILDTEIRENEEALMNLLEQARKCIESSDSSNSSDVELPIRGRNNKRDKINTKKCLKQTLQKVQSKLDAEHDRCESRSKRRGSISGMVEKKASRKSSSKKAKEYAEDGWDASSTTSRSDSDVGESYSSVDDSSDDEEEMVQRVRKGRNKDRKGKRLKSGICEKSRCADIEIKCKWPSSMLDGVFDDDEIEFKNLTLAQFLYGELCIWEKPTLNKNELKARIYLVKKILKNEPKLGFEKAKEMYKMFLTRVEKGIVCWKRLACIDRIETEVILKCINIQERSNRFSKIENKKKLDTVWCKDFNKGTCTLADNHEILFQGKMVKVNHICRKCFIRKKEKNRHREIDSTCPLRE